MKFFEKLYKKEEPIVEGVCIPDHAKSAKQLKEAEELEQELENNGEQPSLNSENKKTKNVFQVTGQYNAGKLLMLSGFVESGSLKKKMKAKKDKTELTITEIRIGSEKVSELLNGEQGTLFLRITSMPNVKYGEMLEFK